MEQAASESYETDQERFWAGEFGDQYISRNNSQALVMANAIFFSDILKRTGKLASALELGCNVGLNLEAFKMLSPSTELVGYEINEAAARMAAEKNVAQIKKGTIIDRIECPRTFDLTFTKGVLIHIDPERLKHVYENLFQLSRRYLLVCEYYNPTPVEVLYRGNSNKLFKRDFAGEMMEHYPLKLIGYGFLYRRDPHTPQDDLSWFLMEKL